MKTINRLRAAQILLILQNMCVILDCIIVGLFFFFQEEISAISWLHRYELFLIQKASNISKFRAGRSKKSSKFSFYEFPCAVSLSTHCLSQSHTNVNTLKAKLLDHQPLFRAEKITIKNLFCAKLN